jgi:glycolate oxidase iron-sulfur subunit
MASDGFRWPAPDEAPNDADLSRCVHCGLCVNACPTYAITGLEAESPRGRIALAKGVGDGIISLTAAVQGHWELCLQCRACETACPSGVPYGRIMEHARAQLDAAPVTGKVTRRMRKLVLRNIVARRSFLSPALACIRLFANSGLRSALQRSRIVPVPARIRALEAQLPHHQGRPYHPGQPLARPVNEVGRAVLFTGCIMGELFGNVHRATARVLAKHGIRCESPTPQGCCGALSAHDGDLSFARKLARENIAAFELAGEVPIVVNSAGCGAAMKEYGELLNGDTRWHERAKRFSARVRDLSELLVEQGTEVPATFEARVTYQDPCHLVHAQKVREQPRTLLRTTGCELVETAGSDMCCGAAGLYGLVQPAMSASLRSRKADQFRIHQPEVIVTANPGCHMQYEAAIREAGIDARVLHLAEFLDEAYRTADQ